MSEIRFLSARDVRDCLPMGAAVEAMRQAFLALGRGEAIVPPRSHIEVEEHDGSALFMPACHASSGCLGVKIVTLFGGNAARGLPRLHALVVLSDATTGRPVAILEGATLTAIRTGATSALATDLLAPPGARTAAILGAGVQARTQLEGICHVRPIEQALVFDPRPEAAESFARAMSAPLEIEVGVATSAAEALREAAVVCAATTSSTPVFGDEDVAPGTHINAIGSYRPEVREIPADTVARARVVTDHADSALAEAGDLIAPLREGRFAEAHVRTELADLLSGEAAGRSGPEEVTLFKSVGIAIQDLVAAARALERAERAGRGALLSA